MYIIMGIGYTKQAQKTSGSVGPAFLVSSGVREDTISSALSIIVSAWLQPKLTTVSVSTSNTENNMANFFFGFSIPICHLAKKYSDKSTRGINDKLVYSNISQLAYSNNTDSVTRRLLPAHLTFPRSCYAQKY